MLLKQAQFHLTQTLEYLCWSFTLKHILRPGLGPNLQSISSVLLTVVVESRLLAFYSMISQEPLTWCLSSAILLPHCLPPYRSVTAKPQTPYYLYYKEMESPGFKPRSAGQEVPVLPLNQITTMNRAISRNFSTQTRKKVIKVSTADKKINMSVADLKFEI